MGNTAIYRGQGDGRHTRSVQTRKNQNVGETERWLSVVGGSLLALYGISRLSKGGILPAVIGTGLVCRGVAGHCSVYEAMGVSTAEPRGSATSVPAGRGVRVERAIHVNRPAADMYDFWRNLENLPRFMRHIKSITTAGNRSHWIVQGPMGMSVQWDAEIINDRPHELIGWRSLPGADVDHAGSVHFEPASGGWGTRVTVILKYDPPAGRVGAAFAQLFGQEPEKQIEEDLERFKHMMETGEAPTTSSAAGGRITWPAE